VYFDPTALPSPWPVGVLSIVVSVITGFSGYKPVLPKQTLFTKIGWSITFVRAVGLGVSAIIGIVNHKYNGLSSDGFLTLFANVVGLMAAYCDYGEYYWAAAGVVAMLFGIFPRLGQLIFAWVVRAQRDEDSFAPFRYSDGTQCIIDPSSTCNNKQPQESLPYCAFPVIGRQGLITIVDGFRMAAFIFA
jgi:hypothetical protein